MITCQIHGNVIQKGVYTQSYPPGGQFPLACLRNKARARASGLFLTCDQKNGKNLNFCACSCSCSCSCFTQTRYLHFPIRSSQLIDLASKFSLPHTRPQHRQFARYYGLRAQKQYFLHHGIHCAVCNRLLCFLWRMLASLSSLVCQATHMLLPLPSLCPPSMLYRMLRQYIRVVRHLNHKVTATASSTSSIISTTGCS